MEQMIDWIDKSLDNCDLISKMTLGFNPKQVIECLEQTKKQAELLVEKEKAVIIEAYKDASERMNTQSNPYWTKEIKEEAEQYYKETFKQ